MTIEARKLNAMKSLADLENEAILYQIENLLHSEKDFYDELSEKEKKLMAKGIDDLNNGRTISYTDIKKSLSKKSA